MIRTILAAALLFGAAACDRAQEKTPQQQETQTPPATQACNDVAINPALSVSPTGAAAATEVEAALLGGPIAPGTYDLTRVEQRAGAPAWEQQVWETLRVTETTQGQTLDFVVARGSASAEPQRFTARLQEDPGAALVFTCGRTGQAAVGWTAQANELQLLLPADSGAGQTLFVFARRAA